ncbi:hypothetical protein B0O99DRAFT_641710 [Bisporella sp. PMI_857]|nr:hypothetical protein B0O99DRAFT_641710 [Bisporella sp. PMI_857]
MTSAPAWASTELMPRRRQVRTSFQPRLSLSRQYKRCSYRPVNDECQHLLLVSRRNWVFKSRVDAPPGSGSASRTSASSTSHLSVGTSTDPSGSILQTDAISQFPPSSSPLTFSTSGTSDIKSTAGSSNTPYFTSTSSPDSGNDKSSSSNKENSLGTGDIVGIVVGSLGFMVTEIGAYYTDKAFQNRALCIPDVSQCTKLLAFLNNRRCYGVHIECTYGKENGTRVSQFIDQPALLAK